jgi:hypothetical protein
MGLPGCDLDVIWDEPTGSEVSTTLMLEYDPILLLYLPQTHADLDIVLLIVAGFASGMATCFTQVHLFIIVIEFLSHGLTLRPFVHVIPTGILST